MCMIMKKKVILKAFKDTISKKITTIKEFFVDIENRFVKNEKVEMGTLVKSLILMRYRDKGNIQEYIIKMSHIAFKLRALKLKLSEDLLVHLILISFST